jgi:NAD(P)-dependent dehydrogenase (short-subunit alcohol dehydrogenase family)
MARLKDKVAVVTGGSFGIGKAACEIMAKEGAKVAITDIQDEDGEKVAQTIENNGGKARFWHLDVSQEKEVEKVLGEIEKEFGQINVLVNNAGISGVNRPTHELTLEQWQKVLDININGVFLCTKHTIPKMKKAAGGSIINLSSIYGLVGAPDIPPYHASKGAVRLMTKTDALFYAQDNIRVNSVHPGYIWTPLVEELAERSEMSVEQFRKELDSKHPIGHVGEPEDIAWGIVYLASDESKFVTGSELVIDGGYTAR